MGRSIGQSTVITCSEHLSYTIIYDCAARLKLELSINKIIRENLLLAVQGKGWVSASYIHHTVYNYLYCNDAPFAFIASKIDLYQLIRASKYCTLILR